MTESKKTQDNLNTVHYGGLVAEWYDDLLAEEKNDITFYSKIASDFGGKVLELACGTGRILIPIKQSGIEIDGVDASNEMLGICREKLSSIEIETNLLNQDIKNLDLPEKYNTIFISGGSFQLIDNFDDGLVCLRSIYQHLLPGGKFVLDIFKPLQELATDQKKSWEISRTAERKNGEKLIVYSNNEYDIAEQLINGLYKYELYSNGKLKETIVKEIKLRWYGQYEFKLMLENVGFINVKIDTRNIMSVHGNAFVYYAEKP